MTLDERPKRLPSADRRRQILEVAAQLFIQRGFEVVVMGDIAALLGISRPAIYSYFTSTEALLDALLEERLQALLGRLDPLLRSMKPAPEDQHLIRTLEAVFELLLSEHETLALLHSGGGPAVRARRHAFLDALGARLELNPELRIKQNPALLLIVTTLLESVAYRVTSGAGLHPADLTATVALFTHGGARSVLEQGEGAEM